MALVEMEGVTKTYGGDGDTPAQTVLDTVDLQVERGESLAIVGPSGSGKSTVLNLLGALDVPTAGTVRFDGEDLAGFDAAATAAFRNRHVGFIFQDHHLLPQCTVRENVLLPTLAGRSGASTQRVARANELLERVGLGDRGNDWPRHLSGGERQRVAVVRALINEPELLLGDEPTGALDQNTSAELGDLLAELNREQGTTLIIVTHQMELAERMERMLELRGGAFTAK
ncbi:MAG: ABC transporter ATP-binding protein [Planctomycetota bacterium]